MRNATKFARNYCAILKLITIISAVVLCVSITRNVTRGVVDTVNHKKSFRKCIFDEVDTDRKYSMNRVVNKVLTDYRPDIRDRFQYAVDHNLTGSDPNLISLIRDMMDAPSTHIGKLSNYLQHTPQSKKVSTLLKDKKNGFFIECGAMDGEQASNTIWLEQENNWTGLLIEADPYMYTQILGKNRRAWSINACLSPSRHAQWMIFAEDIGQRGQVLDGKNIKPDFLHGPERKIPCLPLDSMLLSLPRKLKTRVDYFSLDIEGAEMGILTSIPHSSLDIKVWTVEYDKVGIDTLKSYMEKVGYKTEDKIDFSELKRMQFSHDLLFVKK